MTDSVSGIGFDYLDAGRSSSMMSRGSKHRRCWPGGVAFPPLTPPGFVSRLAVPPFPLPTCFQPSYIEPAVCLPLRSTIGQATAGNGVNGKAKEDGDVVHRGRVHATGIQGRAARGYTWLILALTPKAALIMKQLPAVHRGASANTLTIYGFSKFASSSFGLIIPNIANARGIRHGLERSPKGDHV